MRRFEARIYVGLPAREERGAYIRAQLDGIGHALDDEDFERILNRCGRARVPPPPQRLGARVLHSAVQSVAVFVTSPSRAQDAHVELL